MSYWKGKLLPRIKKYFGKGRKKGAVEAAKSFDESKASVANEIQEQKDELGPKVVEIYRDSKPESKNLLKEATEEGVKTHAEAASGLLQRLMEAGCPGALALKEAGDKYGVASLAPQVAFLFDKISLFVANEEPPVISKDIGVVKENGSAENIGNSGAISADEENVSEIAVDRNLNQPTEAVNKTSTGVPSEDQKVLSAANSE